MVSREHFQAICKQFAAPKIRKIRALQLSYSESIQDRKTINAGRPIFGTPIHQAGFSLIEILVALAIIGLVLGLATPAMFKSIAAARFEASARVSAKVFPQLRARALISGTAYQIVFTPNSEPDLPNTITHKLRLPPGWTANGEPVYIAPSGVCSGGEFTLSDGQGRRARYLLAPINCTAKRVTD